MIRQITVREATFQLLRAFRMTTIFGNPGSTELPMFRDFPGDFRYVLALQESLAVAMADGYAQATRNAALINLHSAAGVGHALGNLFTAYRNKTPLVVTAGQQARSILPYDPFLCATQATEFPKPYVKYSVEPARAQDVPQAIARAYYMAMQPPCGPTFVSIPVDDWDCMTTPIASRTVSTSTRPDAGSIARVGAALDSSRRPALVVGSGIDREDAWQEAVKLSERYEAHVYVAPRSARGSFPEDHRLHGGFLPPMREKIVERLQDHDLILVLGAAAFLYHVAGSGPHIPPGSVLFQITEDPEFAAWCPVGTSVVANLKPALEDLLRRPAPPARESITVRANLPRVTPSDPINEAFVLQSLADTRAPDSIIVEEAPGSRAVMQQYLPITRPRTFFTCASGGLGHGLPAAVGIALGCPDRKVIAVLGDGSSMYSIQGLYSAVQLQLPITFIVINNQRYQSLDTFATLFGITNPVGTRLSGIDFVGLAAAQGCAGWRVEHATEVAGVLRDALRSTRPNLVDVLVS